MIAASQELVTEHGIDACTVDEVARRSGVAKTTIYRHFRNADDLVMTAIAEMVEEIATPDHGSLRADVRAVVQGFRTVARHDSFRQVFAEMLVRSMHDEEFKRLYCAAQETRHAPLRRVLQRGIARGEVDPDIDVETAMYFVQGPFVAKRLIENEPLDDDEIEVFLDLVERALEPRRGERSQRYRASI